MTVKCLILFNLFHLELVWLVYNCFLYLICSYTVLNINKWMNQSLIMYIICRKTAEVDIRVSPTARYSILNMYKLYSLLAFSWTLSNALRKNSVVGNLWYSSSKAIVILFSLNTILMALAASYHILYFDAISATLRQLNCLKNSTKNIPILLKGPSVRPKVE